MVTLSKLQNPLLCNKVHCFHNSQTVAPCFVSFHSILYCNSFLLFLFTAYYRLDGEPYVTVHCFGRTRSRGKRWAAIQLSHHPKPSGCAVQSMRRSVDWTLEDNMVDGFIFCDTLRGLRSGHASFVQAGEETSNTGAEAVKPDPSCSWMGHSKKMGRIHNLGYVYPRGIGVVRGGKGHAPPNF